MPGPMNARSAVCRMKICGSSMRRARRILPLTFAAELRSCRDRECGGGGIEAGEDLVSGLAGGGAGDQRATFNGGHEARGLEEARPFAKGDREKPVFVGVDELAGLDGDAEHLHGATPADRVAEAMADAQAAGQGLEAGIGHFVEVANAPVADRADTAQGAVEVAVDLAPKRTVGAGFVAVLDDHDFRAWHTGDVPPIFAPRLRVAGGMGGIARFDEHGHGITDHRSHLGHEIAGLLDVHQAAPVGAGVLLQAVVDGGRVPPFQFKQFPGR